MSEYKNCGLWKALESQTGSHAEECRTTLRAIMPEIQAVLASGGTSPKDFTLHDAGHSFRVAKRMGEVAGNILTNLTCFELSLLLLSAYLHDIGMTPEFKKVDAHFTYLLTAGLDRGAAFAHLQTDSERAARLYGRLGFEHCGGIDIYAVD